jgi:hypothetical protein
VGYVGSVGSFSSNVGKMAEKNDILGGTGWKRPPETHQTPSPGKHGWPIDFACPDEWASAVTRYLADKRHARIGVVAKEALDIYAMSNPDWWRLVLVVLALGWRPCRSVDGWLVWRPAGP